MGRDLGLIQNELRYMRESADRLGKKDLKNAILGTVMSLSTDKYLIPALGPALSHVVQILHNVPMLGGA